MNIAARATIAPPPASLRGEGWVVPLLVLAAGLVALGWVFRAEGVAAVTVWENSAAYNHCWLVLPVALWLGWTRRHRLAALAPRPTPWAALPALGAGCAWWLAERLGVMEGRQFAALAAMLSLVLAVLGWRVCRAMAAPLLYLVFLVPFGAFLVPALQRVTAVMIVMGLELLGIPHHADGLIIELAAGTFLVAEACAGLRFIIASLAFGALYALVMFRSPGRRVLVMVLALVVPVVANGMRALGIVLLGHHWGSAEAAAADHLIYGWVFFSAVILLLILAGLPFREDRPEPAPPIPLPPAGPWRGGRLAAAAGLTLGAGLAMPGLAAALDRAPAGGAERIVMALSAGEGCADEGAALRCGALVLRAELRRFPASARWSAVVAERQLASGQEDEAVTFAIQTEGARWEARQPPGGADAVAVAAWHGGAPAGDGLRARATRLWQGLGGAAGRPVLAVISIEAPGADPRQARALLRRLLEQGAAAGVAAAARAQSEGG
ncbi:exosortase A [Sediminicoccus sp. BL-A-41-H5]|uniref:exosortase A n=1 Tax=Sediminicoccus sp. BL-A-41-H5 TaxID=3421106 RepID=UPI003D66CFE7